LKTKFAPVIVVKRVFMFSCLQQVESSYDAGDYDGALRNSNISKWLNIASIFCGIVFIIIIFATGT